MNPLAVAQYGLIAATNRFAESAQKVATMGVEGANVDLASEFVNMTLAKTDLSANVAVIRTADEMQGALLDILA
ncbi:flagellar basal body rod C-terminal domain-containing protein [Phenylobacterium sp.]|jgi:flagellar hook protein FlgE|uniref:flagellar basal body rod C-terminal domain-containing protein n=1 Tax=Phenylobacterium sp. TaxID=1871053 RepID=UPI0025E1AE7B|nr:flagellar basal body rod C-terminal domain-containing protein [Phenylobacterium sp.]MCA6286489.1 flagellar hook protein FlgE [Phenylobacterium sp.]MCA6289119.1 flagellar hook protein FlgE [Phenylobacterium sp.]MCA6310693.1 flagellar hook protein FlgE [Phenylobacterium sp.]MCA6323840.1 flagellar hook protein FlgE [Phenylobacterium sp.]MCA6336296.1 flagellar hook protein FlgE [Phenylobacterium sp.]